MARRIRTNLNSVPRNAERNALKAAINNSLRAYMNNPQSNANLQKVNNATKALIKTYVEEQQAAASNGNGGNKPLMLTNSNKPSNNGVKTNNRPVALNGNGGNNGNPLGVGNLANNGTASAGKSKYNGITAKLNTMKEPNAQTYLSLNALKRAVKSNANSNAKEAMLQKITNKKANLDTVRVSRNVTAKAIKAAENAAEAERAEKAAQNAKNVKAAENAAEAAREAAIKAAENARQASEAAKKIAANAIASVVEKQAAANAKAAANKAAANAKAAANKAAANAKAAANKAAANATAAAKNITAKAIAGAIKRNNGNPLGVGNLVNNGTASAGKSKYNGITAKLNNMKEPNAQTYLSLNALKRAVKSNANSNAKEAMLQKITNKKANLDTVRVSRNITAKAIKAAANKAAANAAEKQKAANALEAKKRVAKLLEESKRVMNAAHAKLMDRINSVSTSGQLNAIVSNIARNGKNFNAQKKTNLLSKVKNKRRQIAIQQKKNDGQGVRLARATRSNNGLASANLNRGNLMNRYSKYRGEINAATSKKELNRLVTVLGGKTGKLFSENEKANARAAINRKSNSLKGSGPLSNVPPPMTNGPKNNTVSKMNLAQLNQIIRLTKARLQKGDSKNKTKNERILANATWRANQLRSKKKGLFGHIGGALGAVGGAAKYVAAGTAHHTTRGVKAAAGVATKVAIPLALAGAAYLGQQGAKRGFNVTVGGKGSKKIPNTKIGNNGIKKPGKLARAVQKNENIAAARKAYHQSVGGNASENAMSAAGAFGALAVAGGVKAAAGVKRAVNIGRAVKAGKFTAKTLGYPVKL